MPETFEDYSSSYLNDPSKTLFSPATVDRLSAEGENNFAVEYPCILTRISLAVVGTGGGGGLFDSTGGLFDSATGLFDSGGGSGGISFSNIFTLPDDVISIRRITWRGYKLDPLPQRNFREVFQNATQQGRPFWYVFNQVGQNLVQLFPTPNENLAAATTDLWGSAIGNCFMIEYYRAPDFINYTIPNYFRRRLLKSYVLRGCFNIEGQGQNRKASQYFKERWRMQKESYGLLMRSLHNKPRKLVVNGISSSYYFPGAPLLPINRFGTSVDAGE